MSMGTVENTRRILPSRMLKSAMIWLLAFALSFLLIALLLPAKVFNAADGVTSTFRVLVTKLASFLPSREQPEIVLMGSSLVLTPAVRCDDKMEGKTPCYERWYYDRYIPEYTRASYFQKQLNENAGVSVQIKNLGVASSIMSDQYAIFKLMLKEQKRPDLLILGLAPRDFLDNTQQRHLETPTRMFVREYDEAPLTVQGLNKQSWICPHECNIASTKCSGSSARVAQNLPAISAGTNQESNSIQALTQATDRIVSRILKHTESCTTQPILKCWQNSPNICESFCLRRNKTI
jgi:hypothetical protein